MLREFRSMKVRELRAEKTDDGKRYLNGYAALYNVLSEDLGWRMRERIMPGAFTRAIEERHDVRHLINHDPSLVLGRTKAGTTDLSEDSKGLKFRTELPDTSYAGDLFASVQRGDIDECSFGFVAVKTAWIDAQDPDNPDYQRSIRELYDVDLFDISTVTYPAYPGTNTTAERSLRALWPDGVPAEIRSHMNRAESDECACDCAACADGDCAECSNADCEDENCAGCPAQAEDRARRQKNEKTKRVDGEDLTVDCFLIVGDSDKPKTWKLPWKFVAHERTANGLVDCLARFNQVKDLTDGVRQMAWTKLVALCKEHGIDVSEDDKKSIRDRLTEQQLWDLRSDFETERARAIAAAVQASL